MKSLNKQVQNKADSREEREPALRHIHANDFLETLTRVLVLIAACASIFAVVLICFFLFSNGLEAMFSIGVWDFLSGQRWKPSQGIYGILPMILGSIYVTGGALVIGIPTGLFTAVYMARFCPARVYRILKPIINLLAGIPSVIYGFFALTVIVPMVGNLTDTDGMNMLSASILLGMMILPTVIGVAESALRAVPESYYEGSRALGAGHEHSVFFAVLPAAKSGVLAGIVLGVGRAIGETMAVIMVAGNQARMPNGILKGIRTLTVNIAMEMGYATDLHRGALIATGVVLFVFILIINMSFQALKGRQK